MPLTLFRDILNLPEVYLLFMFCNFCLYFQMVILILPVLCVTVKCAINYEEMNCTVEKVIHQRNMPPSMDGVSLNSSKLYSTVVAANKFQIQKKNAKAAVTTRFRNTDISFVFSKCENT